MKYISVAWKKFFSAGFDICTAAAKKFVRCLSEVLRSLLTMFRNAGLNDKKRQSVLFVGNFAKKVFAKSEKMCNFAALYAHVCVRVR